MQTSFTWEPSAAECGMSDATSASPDWTPLTDSLPASRLRRCRWTRLTLVSNAGSGHGPPQQSIDPSIGVEGDDQVGLYYTTNGGADWFQFNQTDLARTKSFTAWPLAET